MKTENTKPEMPVKGCIGEALAEFGRVGILGQASHWSINLVGLVRSGRN